MDRAAPEMTLKGEINTLQGQPLQRVGMLIILFFFSLAPEISHNHGCRAEGVNGGGERAPVILSTIKINNKREWTGSVAKTTLSVSGYSFGF